MNIPLKLGRGSSASSGGPVPLLALGTFAVGTDAFVVAGFLPELADDLDVSTSTAGLSVTVFAIGYALLSPVLAAVTATVPRRRLLVTALLVLGIANLGSALAPGFVALLASRVLAAAGAAAYTPNAGVAASSLVPAERRGRALALVVSGLTVATAVGVPLGGLASRVMGWRPALGLVAGLCLLVAAGLMVLLPRLPGGPRVPLGTRLAVLRVPSVRLILPVTVLGMAAAYTAYAYAVPVFAALDVTGGAVQQMLFLYGVGAIVGAQSSGRLTDRFGGTAVLLTGYTAMAGTLLALGALVLTGASPVILVALLTWVWGASTWCQTPPQQHRLMAAAPEDASLVVALNSSGIYVGIGLGTLIGGLGGGASWMFLSGAALAILTAVFLTTIRPVSRR
ncbi:MFS transporter [Aeromicrobium sp. YIM 150415]|uniref:MFS transporter n=1 Tax=Aeromicrobium sp. YIM 150415 TaxID=2803912 RepID=UPI00196325DD|nr:MFS transporter [Aeromicrobium sp. YIM 150415]MBM9461844.1 MFS transporter [Aeromicrobium sp. YIM 150415]MBM9463192.1 MFS transporter [Aeromicrobium sp. YIM 150415]